MFIQSKPLHLRSLQNHASNVFFFLFVSLSYFIYLFFTFGKWRELQSSVPGTLLYMNNQWPFDRLLIIDHNKKQKRTRRKDPTIRTEMDVVLGSNLKADCVRSPVIPLHLSSRRFPRHLFLWRSSYPPPLCDARTSVSSPILIALPHSQ